MPATSSVVIGPADLAIVIVYVAGTTLLGILLGRGQTNNRDYFLGGRRLPTWALLVSIVATETSTVTFLSVPGLSYAAGGNFTFLQLAAGYIVGRLAIVAWLLPGYFRGEILSAYEVLERRFGMTTRRLAALVFLITRNVADGLRLFLTALALNIAVGLDLLTCILVITVATAIYSCLGGVRSVVWNDCIQFAVYMLGAMAAMALLLWQLPGGWGQLLEFAESTGRLRMFDFDPLPQLVETPGLGEKWQLFIAALVKPSITFWSGCIGGAFLSLATHGADQLIVQRYLCAKSQSAAAWAISLSGVIVFLQFALFLMIGVALACFYSLYPAPGGNPDKEQALMTFVVQHMGTGLRGLILAAVLAAAMSTLSSSLNSSANSLANDWLGRFLTTLGERKSLLLSRGLTLVFACVQAAVAVVAFERNIERSIVDAVLAVAGFSTGLVLGLYGLGLMMPRTSERVALAAFAVGMVVTSLAAFGTQLNSYWYTLVGSGTIVLVGSALSAVVDRPPTVSARP